MDRCINCRHWDKGYPGLAIDRGGFYSIDYRGRQGACLRSTTEGNESGSLAVAIALRHLTHSQRAKGESPSVPEADDRFLLTSPYFGCVMHEPRT